jgi:stress response protein YsnF
VPIERLVEEAIPVRYEGDTMIVSVLEEVLVVEKRLMLKEELHIRKRRVERHQPQCVTLRHEEARVEHINLKET